MTDVECGSAQTSSSKSAAVAMTAHTTARVAACATACMAACVAACAAYSEELWSILRPSASLAPALSLGRPC